METIGTRSTLLGTTTVVPVIGGVEVRYPGVPRIRGVKEVSSFGTNDSVYYYSTDIDGEAPDREGGGLANIGTGPWICVFFYTSFGLLRREFFYVVS